MQKGAPKQGEGVDLTYWAEHTLMSIKRQMAFRGIYPYGNPGPYFLFDKVNAERKRKGKWYSKGKSMGPQQMYARVFNAANGNTEKISFFWLKYLAYADMGVGKFRPKEKVKESSTAAKWDKNLPQFTWGVPTDVMTASQREHRPKGTQSRRSRPVLRMELRHQAFRLEKYILPTYYSYIVQANVFDMLEDTFKGTDINIELFKSNAPSKIIR